MYIINMYQYIKVFKLIAQMDTSIYIAPGQQLLLHKLNGLEDVPWSQKKLSGNMRSNLHSTMGISSSKRFMSSSVMTVAVKSLKKNAQLCQSLSYICRQ